MKDKITKKDSPLRKKIPVSTGGRFREYDREEVANLLLEWSKEDDSLHLNGFCVKYLIAPDKLYKWAKECDNFNQYYLLSKAFIGKRREDMFNKGTLHSKLYELNVATYDYFLKQERRDQSDYEAKLKEKLIEFEYNIKHKVLEKVSDDVKEQFDSLMKQISDMKTK